MNLESAKSDFVGGPLDGDRLVVLSTTNDVLFHHRVSNRTLVYVLKDDKYYFKGYERSK